MSTVQGLDDTRPYPSGCPRASPSSSRTSPIDLPEATVVAPALERVRASGLPQALPADADFDPGTHALAAAYGLSLLALRTLADAHGTQAVVRLYRAAAGGLDVPTSQLDDREAAVDDALRSMPGHDAVGTRAGLAGAHPRPAPLSPQA